MYITKNAYVKYTNKFSGQSLLREEEMRTWYSNRLGKNNASNQETGAPEVTLFAP